MSSKSSERARLDTSLPLTNPVGSYDSKPSDENGSGSGSSGHLPSVSDMSLNESTPEDQTESKKKKKKKTLLKGTFLFEGHRHKVYLSLTGVHWTRFSSKGRLHFLDYRDIIGVNKPTASAIQNKKSREAQTFKIVGVTPKQDKTGLRKPQTISFSVLKDYSEAEPEVVIEKWAETITTQANLTRPLRKKKLLFLINPFSGKKEGIQIWKSIKPYFKMAGFTWKATKTEFAGHAEKIALTFNPAEYCSLICISGDGLMNEVLNGVLDRKDYRDIIKEVTFGVIPAGSGNGLCGSLYAPDPFTAAFAIIKGTTHPLDVFTMLQSNKRKYGFLNICWATMSVIDLESEGFRWLGPIRWDIKGIAEIATNYSYKGKISYLEVPSTEIVQRTEQELPSPDSKPPLCHIIDDDDLSDWTHCEGEWSFFIACNTTKAILGPGELARFAQLSDGCIDLILAPQLGRVDLTALLLGIDNGSLVDLPYVQYIKVKAFKLEPDNSPNVRKAPISIDGEHTNNASIKVEMHPALINIYHDNNLQTGTDIEDEGKTNEEANRKETRSLSMVPPATNQRKDRPATDAKLATPVPKGKTTAPKESAKNNNQAKKQLQASINDKSLMATSQIKPDEIEIIDTLGVGSCATVYRGYWQHTEVAIKIINSKKSTKQSETLIDEAKLMVTMRHPNVVPLYGAWLAKPVLFIVTEYMARGDVYSILHNDDIVIERRHVIRMALDTARGMTYLHSRNIIHRDLKTLNILVDANWLIKVADFGLARVIEDAVFAQALTACGTTSWTAPEVLREQNYTLNADVYSFAICLWEMATRQEPFADLYAPQVVLAVAVEGKRLEIPDTVPREVASIIMECWQEDPNKRPTFVALVDRLSKIELEEPTHPTPWSKKEELAKKQTNLWSAPSIFLEE